MCLSAPDARPRRNMDYKKRQNRKLIAGRNVGSDSPNLSLGPNLTTRKYKHPGDGGGGGEGKGGGNPIGNTYK